MQRIIRFNGLEVRSSPFLERKVAMRLVGIEVIQILNSSRIIFQIPIKFDAIKIFSNKSSFTCSLLSGRHTVQRDMPCRSNSKGRFVSTE